MVASKTCQTGSALSICGLVRAARSEALNILASAAGLRTETLSVTATCFVQCRRCFGDKIWIASLQGMRTVHLKLDL